jgi:hypothetical protein
MKQILIFLLLCFSINAFCQSNANPDQTGSQPTIEELKRDILQLQQDTQDLQLNLHKAHREFRTGTIFYAVGLGLTVLAAGSDRPSDGLILIGTGFLIAGGVLHIDSHKYIGRAGYARMQYRRRN